MSKENTNVTNCKQRFKAIETFLRRVAFNLGATTSEARRSVRLFATTPDARNEIKCEYIFVACVAFWVAQRFFRLADFTFIGDNFILKWGLNSGNTPSQTEVKIISCIPIDVTDLQQKIFQLQKELEQARNSVSVEYPYFSGRPAVFNPICSACNIRHSENPKGEVICEESFHNSSALSLNCPYSRYSLPKKQNLSMVCPSQSNRTCSYNNQNITNMENPCKNKNLFSKKKMGCNKRKCKTQLVYCAQTNTNTPFRKNLSLTDDETTPNFPKDSNKKENLSRSYLENMVVKQYKPQVLGNYYSNLSEFSTPICRDNILKLSNPLPSMSEYDVCSCCNGQFHNIDHYMNNKNMFDLHSTWETIGNYNKNAYYDSKYYDLVPVKEKPLKKKNDFEFQKRKSKKPTIKCWTEKVRPKYKVVPSMIVNYCSVTPAHGDYMKKYPAKLQKKRDIVMNKMAAKPVKYNKPCPDRGDIDFSPVYTKQVAKEKKQKIFSTAKKMCNVATWSPTTNNNADCQTATAENPPEDKTETTLNQIKDILQSVLTEVKTSSKLGKPVELPKKDAVVQNGLSQSNMFGASQLLNSYSYSPYNINPYIPSCSHQMSSNYMYPEYPNMQGRHLQQYPLLIQPQKHLCTNCFRNAQVTKSVNTGRATCAATNTEQTQERSKETERLIKEIYKSMALNIEIPSSKDSSFVKYSKPNSGVKKSVMSVKMKNNSRESNRVSNTISEIFRNKNLKDGSVTGDTTTTLTSNVTSDQTKIGSHRAVKKELFNERVYYQKYNSTTETMGGETEQMSRDLETEEQSDPNIVNEATEESNGETETDVVSIEIKDSVKTIEKTKEKSGIFQKMFKIFQPRQRRRRRDDATKEVKNESESDSDDYQTVYSRKVPSPKPKKVTAVRSRPHSKVFYAKQPQQRRSRTRSPEKSRRNSPYMEQMYRKYWDDKMIREKRHQKHASDFSRQTWESQNRRRPVYYQNYDARSVLVDPTRQVPTRIPVYIQMQENAQFKSRNYDNSVNGPNNPTNGGNYFGNGQQKQRAIPQSYNPNTVRNNVNQPVSNSHIRPHYVVSKSNGQRKNMTSSKGMVWLKKHKFKCSPQWKDLIING